MGVGEGEGGGEGEGQGWQPSTGWTDAASAQTLDTYIDTCNRRADIRAYIRADIRTYIRTYRRQVEGRRVCADTLNVVRFVKDEHVRAEVDVEGSAHLRVCMYRCMRACTIGGRGRC